MPIHDWRRVTAGVFHDFHQAWVTELRTALNTGLLPDIYYALTVPFAAEHCSDVLAHQEADDKSDWDSEPSDFDSSSGGAVTLAVAEHPPRLRFTVEAEEAIYAARASRIAIRHRSGDRVVAFIEIVSPGNKHSESAVRQLIGKLADALAQGRHLLVIDLFPPGNHDSQGLHARLWGKADPPLFDDEPLLQVAYRAATSPVAYVEPTAVGQCLSDMPLFLSEEHYVNVPLEATYVAAWRGLPARWKRELERAGH